MKSNEGFKRGMAITSGGLSLLCMIHCLAMPLLIALLPSFAHLFENVYLEVLILGLVLLTGLFVLLPASKKHRQHLPLLIFTLGFLGILSHLFFGHDAELFMILGAILVALSQVWNFLILRKLKSKNQLDACPSCTTQAA